jgi:hypothetical protein
MQGLIHFILRQVRREKNYLNQLSVAINTGNPVPTAYLYNLYGKKKRFQHWLRKLKNRTHAEEIDDNRKIKLKLKSSLRENLTGYPRKKNSKII